MSCTITCVQPSPSQAHCGACHVTFGGISGFDRHRRDGQCLAPEAIGHADNGRGVYRAPMDDRQRERLAALSGNAPSASHRTPETAETGSGVHGLGSGASEAAETPTAGFGDWNWTPTADGGHYSGPHGPDICPRMGCQHEGGAA